MKRKTATQATIPVRFDLCGSYFDVPFSEMTVEQFAEWREDYYLGLLVSPFGKDNDGKDVAPYGISVHGVPKLQPEDE